MASRMQLEDWLDDLCVRFIINLPEEDLSSVARICFQVEEAQWFYEDFIRPLDPALPALSLRQFCLRIFQHCPLLSVFSQEKQMAAFDEFMKYKERIPVRGAIMLNDTMDAAVLVKGWKKGANWSFPRGKINKDEDDLDCAIRELWEETGFDVRAAGLPLDIDHLGEPLDVVLREQHLRFFVFRGVPMDTFFEPKTRKEISKIQWYRLADLPGSRQQRRQKAVNVNKFYMVAKFLPILEKWISKERKREQRRMGINPHLTADHAEDMLTEEENIHAGDANYMSESAPEASHQFAPASSLSSVSGTEAALKALLKIQSPFNGLHPLHDQGHAGNIPGASNKGDALLALLRPSAKPELPPHTPMDALITEIPLPDTPHHQHPRHMPPLSTLQDPPSFSLQNQGGFMPEQFRHPQGPYQQFGQQQHSQHFQQQFPPNQNIYPQFENVHRYAAEPLRHPQPLPPQVQKAMFTEGIVHRPMIPQNPNQTFVNHSQSQYQKHGVPIQPDFSNTHTSNITNSNKQEAPKLTSHSLALLSAFKSQDQGDESRHGEVLRGFENQPIASVEQGQGQNRTMRDQLPIVPHSFPTGNIPANGPPNYQYQGQNTHKSNLLGLFKSPQALAAQPAVPAPAESQPPNLLDLLRSPVSENPPPPNVTANPLLDLFKTSSTQQSMAKLGLLAGEVPLPYPSADKPSSKHTSLKPHHRSPAHGRANNDSLPFQPVSILSRPPQDSSAPSRNTPVDMAEQFGRKEVRSRRSSPRAAVNHRAAAPPPNGTSRPFQPQILKRPSEIVSQAPPSQQHTVAEPPVPATPDRRPSEPAEHKQNLLSLFGKPVPTASSPAQLPVSSPTHVLDRPGVELSRSRVGSLASLGEGSRRTSQTVTSPGDKGFLLGFLDQVAKGSGR